MTVYLPLASSAGWFEGGDLLSSLALRLKVCLLLDWEVVVPSGAFLSTITANDASEQLIASPNVMWNRDAGPIAGIVATPTGVEIKMDWHSVLVAARVVSVDGVSYTEARLDPAVRRALKAYVDVLLNDSDVVLTLPRALRVREAIVKHWLLDCAMAFAEGASIAVDGRAGQFVASANRLLIREGQLSFSEHIVTIRLHDVRQWTWEAVLSFRASSAGERLRQLATKARACVMTGAKQDGLQAEIDAVTGRRDDDANVVVSCLASAPHALVDPAATQTRRTIYIVGVTA